MKNYLLYQLRNEQYDYFLLCLTYESILNYLDKIENEPLMKNSSGKILVDQLLVTGNGRNRFITCDFKCGELILSTAKNIMPDKKYKDLTIKLLQQNYEMLEFSILSDHQRDLVMEGRAF